MAQVPVPWKNSPSTAVMQQFLCSKDCPYSKWKEKAETPEQEKPHHTMMNCPWKHHISPAPLINGPLKLSLTRDVQAD